MQNEQIISHLNWKHWTEAQQTFTERWIQQEELDPHTVLWFPLSVLNHIFFSYEEKSMCFKRIWNILVVRIFIFKTVSKYIARENNCKLEILNYFHQICRIFLECKDIIIKTIHQKEHIIMFSFLVHESRWYLQV